MKYAIIHYKKGIVGENMTKDGADELASKMGGIFSIVTQEKLNREGVNSIMVELQSSVYI